MISAMASLLLACVFTVAGVSKLRATTRFRAALRDLVPDRAVGPLAVATPALELLLGLFLLSGLWPRGAAIAALVVLVAFSVALLRMWKLGTSQDCSCFGESSHAVTPLSGLIRNIALCVAAGVVLIAPDPAAFWQHDMSFFLAVATGVAGVLALWMTWNAIALRHEMLFRGVDGS